MIRAFFHPECEEAPFRRALDVAAPRASCCVALRCGAPAGQRQLHRQAGLEANSNAAEVERWADALADMLLSHLKRLGGLACRAR